VPRQVVADQRRRCARRRQARITYARQANWTNR